MRIAIALLTATVLVGCGQFGPGASSGQTVTPSAAASPAQSTPAQELPPQGLLSAGGDAVTGFLGTYCWQSVCADVFDLPPRNQLPALAASTDMLSFSLESRAGFLSWSASYAPEADEELLPLGQGGSDHDPDTTATLPPELTSTTFNAPPSGEWVVIVQVAFVGGDAQYAWQVNVQ
jgi:hypothetical protein